MHVDQRAAVEDVYDEHEFVLNDAPVLRATVRTPRTSAAGASSWQHKRHVAETQANNVEIVDPDRLQHRRVLLFGDVMTSGSQINEMARVLLDAGAQSVDGVVLARSTYRGSS